MITVFDDAQRAHDPQFFLSSGAQFPCPEKPARVDALLAAVRLVDQRMLAIKGVGKWTAETYLMFCEGRLNVFPGGDVA